MYKQLFMVTAYMYTKITGRDTGGQGGLSPPTFQIGGAWPPHFAKKANIYVGG